MNVGLIFENVKSDFTTDIQDYFLAIEKTARKYLTDKLLYLDTF